MLQKSFRIDVMMDDKTFRDFMLFDCFRYRKVWKRPVFFAVAFTVFAALCFAMRSTREQADLLGTVLLKIGLGLPLVYFALFFRTIADQVKRLGLSKPRLFYTIQLTDASDGIQMSAKGAKDQTFTWEKAERAYRTDDVVYFYVAPGSAVVLPLRDVKQGGEKLWEFLRAQLGEARLTTL